MKIEKNENGKLDFFEDLYREAKAASEDLFAAMDKYYRQYKGTKEIDGGADAGLIRNITYELVESQVTSYVPNPSVTPKMASDKGHKNAKSIETLLRNKRDELPFERMNDIDERYNPIYGGSVWLVEWDESIRTTSTVGDVKVTCLSPKHFTGQPNIYDIDDMEYCFVEFETTKEDIMRRYGVTIEVAEDASTEDGGDDKTATLTVCYYKDEDDKVCQYVWSGDVELLDIEDYYSRKIYICQKCGKRKELCDCEKPEYELQSDEYEELDAPIMTTHGTIPAQSEVIKDGVVQMRTEVMPAVDERGELAYRNIGGVLLPATQEVEVPKTEATKLPYYRLTTLPIVLRKNTSQEDSLFGQSDCEFIRPQQQAINKVETRIMEKLMGGGVYPIVPDDFNMELDNSIFTKVFRCRPNEAGQFGRIDLSVDISRDVAEAERLYDQAKRILGITDSYQGQHDASAQSGKAKQLQIQQAQGRLDSKRQMKNAAYADIYKLIFHYYLAYADEPRPAVYRDAMGRLQNVTFNRYDFIERGEDGKYYYNDEYLFATDATYDYERQRDLLWQENRLNFQQGAYGDPTIPQTQLIFWLNMEQLHYPFASDNVERLKEEIERQAQMAQMQAQVMQAQAQAQAMGAEIESRKGYEEYLKGEIEKARGAQTGAGNEMR